MPHAGVLYYSRMEPGEEVSIAIEGRQGRWSVKYQTVGDAREDGGPRMVFFE